MEINKRMNKFKSFMVTFFYGGILGGSLLAPGFSAATMAMILGIYEDLIALLNTIFSKDVKKGVKPLVALGGGAILALGIFSHIISVALNHFPYQTSFLFLGLILGTIPLLAKQINIKKNFKIKDYGLMLCTFILITLFSFVINLDAVDFNENLTVFGLVYLIIAGMMVSVSLLLPGLSGALMLVLLGVYEFLLHSLSALDLTVLTAVAFGGILGLVVFGRVIKHLIDNSKTTLYAVSLGFIIGSIPIILSDGIPRGIITMSTSLLCVVIGLTVVFLINKKKG